MPENSLPVPPPPSGSNPKVAVKLAPLAGTPVKSETLKITQHLRNEAHRFGITFHRNKRSKSAIQSELEQIPAIGAQTITNLLRKFKSAKRVKEASFEALKTEIGNARALKVYEFYHPEKK